MTNFKDLEKADYAGKPLEMIGTRANLKIQSGLQYAQSINRPVYFIGPAGVGKTVALQEAVNQIECAYYCSTDEATKGYSGMLSIFMSHCGAHFPPRNQISYSLSASNSF